MRYYVIAGEASEDLHGSSLIRELRKIDPQADIRAWGGDRMKRAGAVLVRHFQDLAFMGFIEVVLNLRTILKNLAFCKRDIRSFRPQVVLLIDYPGFNMRIAKWAHQQGFRIVYYISPQIWAWHQSRVKKIKKYVHRMIVILPFEENFYLRHDVPVDFVGHPLMDIVENFEAKALPVDQKSPIVALLPGSRKQEIQNHLPIMLKLARSNPQYHFVVGCTPSIDSDFYTNIIGDAPVTTVTDRTYDLLHYAKAAVVSSGTATLETGLFAVPQIVCYKGSRISYWIARQLVNVKYISLVNLILDHELVPELIQDDFRIENVQTHFAALWDPKTKDRYARGYRTLRAKLGDSGASRRAAEIVFSQTNIHANHQ